VPPVLAAAPAAQGARLDADGIDGPDARAAAKRGRVLPENDSLHTMVSRWENGQSISEFYDELLREIFPEQAMPA
jgi:hypothetical protein